MLGSAAEAEDIVQDVWVRWQTADRSVVRNAPAAYVLREAFDYPYREIANILRLEEANTRQLVTRARQHVADGRRAPVSSAEQRRLVNAFISAAQRGDVSGLEGFFASDVVSTAACAVAA
jgi:DNA-directed RNA polymerase specialized sigma24 family protein